MSAAEDWYLKAIETRSNGRLKFERYWSGSLAPGPDLLDALDSGIADFAVINPSYFPGKLPLGNVGILPFTTKDIWPNFNAFTELYNTEPAMKEEMAKWRSRFLLPNGTAHYYILTRTTPIQKLADLKGLKIRALGMEADLVKAYGAVPVGLAIQETLGALEKGTIDGLTMGPAATVTYKMQDMAKYYFMAPVGGSVWMLAISDKAWNKIPADIQKMMTDLIPDYIKNYHQMYQVEGDGKAIDTMKAAGVTITYPAKEDVAAASKLAKEVIWDKWANDMEAQKLPGKRVLEAYLKLCEKYVALNPFK